MTQTAAIALLERYYAAFHARDYDAMLACLTDDVAHDINQGGRQIGKAAFAAFMQRMDQAHSEELRDMTLMANIDGTRAAAEFVVHGQYLASEEGLPPSNGQSYILPAGTFFDIKGGKIARVPVYYNLAAWIAQVSANDDSSDDR